MNLLDVSNRFHNTTLESVDEGEGGGETGKVAAKAVTFIEGETIDSSDEEVVFFRKKFNHSTEDEIKDRILFPESSTDNHKQCESEEVGSDNKDEEEPCEQEEKINEDDLIYCDFNAAVTVEIDEGETYIPIKRLRKSKDAEIKQQRLALKERTAAKKQ